MRLRALLGNIRSPAPPPSSSSSSSVRSSSSSASLFFLFFHLTIFGCISSMHFGSSGGLQLENKKDFMCETNYEPKSFLSPPVDACGPRRPVHQLEPPPALEHDLPVVLHLAHVGPVVVQAHVAHKEDLKNKIWANSKKV